MMMMIIIITAEILFTNSITCNDCLNQGKLPIDSKKANFVPVHVKGGKQCLKIYKPVSLLPICSKIFEHLFSTWVFFHEHSQFTGQQGKGEAISFILFYLFHLFNRHFDICQVITTASSPLHIASSHTQIRNFWISKCNSLTTKLRTKLQHLIYIEMFKFLQYLIFFTQNNLI